jgi:N6-adenosine-specific RNA methylase IME4
MEKYDVLLIDPPWSFKVYSKDTGEGRSAASHYPTLDLEALKALPVKDLTKPDSALFLWGCNSMIPEALEVMKAWGFEYKTIAFNWTKTNKKATDTVFWGMGFWSRQNSEYVMMGTRGKPKRVSKAVHQVVWQHEEQPEEQPLILIGDNPLPESIVRPVMRHSAKPAEVRERIVQLMGPDLSYLELFARPDYDAFPETGIPAPWDAIGNEIDGLDIRDAIAKRLAGPV